MDSCALLLTVLEPTMVDESPEHHIQFPPMVEHKQDEKADIKFESPPPSYTTHPNGENAVQNSFADFDRKVEV